MADIVIGYVFDKNNRHTGGMYFEGTMENIASFIMNNRWNDTVITDELDTLIVSTMTGGFLDRVDPAIRGPLLEKLVPMQYGETEPKEITFFNEEELSMGAWQL